jgi:2-dehydro-3-deoxy-D-arabinonate dehydratase
MQIAKYRLPSGAGGVGKITADELIPLNLSGGQYRNLFEILEADSPVEVINFLSEGTQPVPLASVHLLPPIDQQEVWAAGVTYKRSRAARMEESDSAADCYDRVYASPRPELFFKASPHRVAGHGQALRIRKDSNWNVPEPELALVLNSRVDIVGYTIGNDMSSRDIEGDNPLYLPQAKVYNECCGLGPWITLEPEMPPREEIGIHLLIRRNGKVVVKDATSVAKMARTFESLTGWLKRDNSFPTGAFLLTGTGIIPDSNFTLLPNDEVEIQIDGIGSLVNRIVQS